MIAGLKQVTSQSKEMMKPLPGSEGAKLKSILDRTGYSLDVTPGQRKYGGPPPAWEGPRPGNGCEIPNNIYEEELIPHLEKCGEIWELRLMMDPMTGLNRGYAFITFTNKAEAEEAVKQLNSLEIVKDHHLKVKISVPNKTRLFVGNIPKLMTRTDISQEFSPHAYGLVDVIIYSSPDSKENNRGFCFLQYDSHKAAKNAKRRFNSGKVKIWSCDMFVDWADPQEDPDEATMSRVKILYCRNLSQAVTEFSLQELFGRHGKVERVKKIKDYAFVHFEERDQALAAMSAINNQEHFGSKLEISLAKPPIDKKKKEEILRAREKRVVQTMAMAESMERMGRGGRGDGGQFYQGRGDGGLPNHHWGRGGDLPYQGMGGGGVQFYQGRGDGGQLCDGRGYGGFPFHQGGRGGVQFGRRGGGHPYQGRGGSSAWGFSRVF